MWNADNGGRVEARSLRPAGMGGTRWVDGERERRRLARVREGETGDVSNGTVHLWAASASTRVRPMGFLSGPKKIRRGVVW